MIRLNLALQGGGSHGAFTWGVLDALLADGGVAFEGLSGTSAGAVNAVALASGWVGGHGAQRHDAARRSLQAFWDEVVSLCTVGAMQARLFSALWGPWAGSLDRWRVTARQALSPYDFNPLDLNPLRQLLERRIDFAALGRQRSLKLYVSATHVATGRATIFHGARVTADAVMASACLPQLFQSCTVDGQAYWDGGYAANPAITPLLVGCDCRDTLLVQINPLQREDLPRSSTAIAERVNEVAFNASLLTQVRLVHAYNAIVAGEGAPAGWRPPMRLHRIDGGPLLSRLPQGSRTSADPALVAELFAHGQAAGRDWLERHRQDVGRRGTIDLRGEYRDDTWLPLAVLAPERPRRLSASRVRRRPPPPRRHRR